MSVVTGGMASFSALLRGRKSLRNQLIAWNIVALALLLAILGIVIRYTVSTYLLESVRNELRKIQQHPPPELHLDGGPPGGRGGGWQMRPFWDRGPRPGNGPDRFSEGPNGPGGPPEEFQGGPRERRQPPPFFEDQGNERGRQPMRSGRPPSEMPWVNDTYFPRNFGRDGRSLFPNDHRPIWDRAGFDSALQGREHFTQVKSDETPVEIRSAPLWSQGRIIGVGQVAYPLTEVYRALAGLDRALLTMIPIGLLCSGIGGAYLTDRVLRRVRQTTQTAARISVTGAGDLSERLPVTGEDEFSELADTFNGLLGRLEVAFQEQARVLEQQRRFTADASHELKTPLTVIKGTASMALGGETTEAGYRRSLQEIDRAASTMSHLVQDLLLLARSDGGQLGKNPIELLVSEVVAQARSGVAAKGATIRVEIADEALTVAGNEMELIRLFTNLLDNAVRYTPEEGRVTVRASAGPGERTLIQIADTGPGIAPEHLPHLGERFYRVDAARARPDGGTGLGLSICRSIVEANHGTIAIQSIIDNGTTVSVALPNSLGR